jgi:parallel beta-helix repeat protein
MTFYLSGIPSTFEKENEWYLDREKGVVYYIPAFGENQENLVGYVPCTGKTFEIFADDVRLVDLEIAYTRGEYESKWERDMLTKVQVACETIYGADIQSVCWAHGAITFQGVARSGVKNCYLHALGVHAIDILEGSSDIRIENNVIEDIGAGGVKVDGGAYGCKEEERTHHCVIRGNTIRNIGLKFSAGCGVLVKHASNNEIAENEIYDMDYTGISVGWVWGYAPSNTFGNLIRGNHIHSTRGNLSDLGGIYLLGKQHGTIVSENRIHDIYCNTYGGWGIYLDEGSQEVLVENNVIFNTQLESVHQHYGANNVVRNNVLVGAGYAAAYFGVVGVPTHENTGFSLENNVVLIHGMPIYQSSEDEYTARNVIWDTKKEPLKVYLHDGAQVDFEEYIKDGKEIGSVISDPLFESAEAFDFTLKENSPAYEIGFHPLTGFLESGKKRKK